MSQASLISIVGGGVCGLSAAILLAEAGWRTRIISPLAALQTTSSKAGAFWYPLHVKGYQPAWARNSYEYFLDLERDSAAHVSLVAGCEFFRTRQAMDDFIAACDWRDLPPVQFHELKRNQVPAPFAGGVGFMLPVIYMPGYLPYLEQRYQAAGGVFERRRLDTLDEALDGSAAMVNCSGLGARELAHDDTVYPSQGQVVWIKPLEFERLILVSGESSAASAPDSGHSASADSLYIIPRRGHDIVLGGTSVDHATDLTPRPQVTRQLIDRCAALYPIFKTAKVIESRVGLRPSRRDGVRTELDAAMSRQFGQPIIHNYGHGGAGVSLSWGCAQEVVRIISAV